MSAISLPYVRTGVFGRNSLPPTSLPGLIAWASADVGAFSDAGVTPVVDAGTVRQWNFREGAGNWSQATAGNRPTWLADGYQGHPVLRFNGTDRWLDTGALAALERVDVTYYLSYIPRGTAGRMLSDRFTSGGGASSGDFRGFVYLSGTQMGAYSRSAAGTFQAAGGANTIALNTPAVVCNRVEAAAISLFLNGYLNHYLPATPAAGVTHILTALGRTGSGGNFAQIDVFDVVMFGGAHSDSQVRAISRFLGDRASIGVA